MKPLDQWTEAELLNAADWELHDLLCKHILNREPEGGDMISGNGMLEVLEAMKTKGIYPSLHARPDGYSCETWKDEKRIEPWEIRSTSLPRAVAVAALLAIKSQ